MLKQNYKAYSKSLRTLNLHGYKSANIHVYKNCVLVNIPEQLVLGY